MIIMRYSKIRPRKLTPEKVTLMRSLRIYNPKVYSCKRLEMIFGVRANMVWKIITNRCWKLVPPPSEEDAYIIAIGHIRWDND